MRTLNTVEMNEVSGGTFGLLGLLSCLKLPTITISTKSCAPAPVACAPAPAPVCAPAPTTCAPKKGC